MIGPRKLLAAAAVAAVLGLLTACGAGTRDDSAVGDPSDFVFDESVIRTYELVIDEADWEWLNDDPVREEYVPATLLFEGKEYPDVAVRYKGFFGALRFCFDAEGNRICEKLSMKLKFSEYNEIGRFYDLKRLNFQAMQLDPTMMHEALGYGLYREAGVAAPRVAYANLVVNGEPLGLFALVEQIDGMFTRSRFPDGGEGNLYKEIWPIYFVPGAYLWALRTNREEDPNVDKMIRFARALDEATDDTFLSVLESWTDVDTLMSYLAVDRLIDNMDGIVAWYCLEGDMVPLAKLLEIVPPEFAGPCFNHNYFWYEDTGRDRVWLIPWDLDNALQVPSMLREIFGIPDWDVIPESCDSIPVFAGLRGQPPACDDLIRRLSTVTWDLYAQRTQELLDGPFQISALHDRIDELADHIADAVAEDPNGPTFDEWQASVQQLKDGVVTIRSYIEAKVTNGEPPASPETSADLPATNDTGATK